MGSRWLFLLTYPLSIPHSLTHADSPRCRASALPLPSPCLQRAHHKARKVAEVKEETALEAKATAIKAHRHLGQQDAGTKAAEANEAGKRGVVRRDTARLAEKLNACLREKEEGEQVAARKFIYGTEEVTAGWLPPRCLHGLSATAVSHRCYDYVRRTLGPPQRASSPHPVARLAIPRGAKKRRKFANPHPNRL